MYLKIKRECLKIKRKFLQKEGRTAGKKNVRMAACTEILIMGRMFLIFVQGVLRLEADKAPYGTVHALFKKAPCILFFPQSRFFQ